MPKTPKPAGDAPATIRDVARRARVTDTTVSLAFQPGSRISEATRKRVQKVAGELRYVPNFAARQLRGGNSRCRVVGLLVTEIANPYYALVAQAAEAAAEQRGYRLTLSSSHWSSAREASAVDGMIEGRLDGVLACFTERQGTASALQRLEQAGIPYLLVDTAPASYRGAAVLNDLESAGRIGARHLLEAGYRRPAFMDGGAEWSGFSAFQALIAGFRDELAKAGVGLPPARVVAAGLTQRDGEQGMARLLQADPTVDAVFCVDTPAAIGALEGLDQAGKAVGREIGVVAVGDLDICALSRISLTSIQMSAEQLATHAMAALADSIESKTPPTVRHLIRPELVARRSTSRSARPS